MLVRSTFGKISKGLGYEKATHFEWLLKLFISNFLIPAKNLIIIDQDWRFSISNNDLSVCG